MPDSQQRWNARHRQAAAHQPPEPAPFLLEALPLLARPGRALDLACGAGQNAVFLARQGWSVAAVDFASAALDRAESLARASGVPCTRSAGSHLPARFTGLHLVEADLERAALPGAAFDLILCFQYLHRALFPRIEHALALGGFLVYETFTEAQRAFHSGPRNPDHLLRKGELRLAFTHLETLFYREWTAGQGMAGIVARKAAL